MRRASSSLRKKHQHTVSRNIDCSDILDTINKLAYSSVGKFKTYYESCRLLEIAEEIELNNKYLEKTNHHKHLLEVELIYKKCLRREQTSR